MLALEALEWINRVNAMDYEYQQKAREALNAIYEALAQPEQEPCGGCGGSGWVPRDPDIGTEQECFDCNGSGAHPNQPEQEPVAWMHEWEDGGSVLSLYPRDARLNDQPKSVRPLVYGDTTPPKPEPHNFCARCGKRLIGMAFAAGGVHTCTPPEGGHQ